jgi:uncharacterized protein involved in exopolysaccharide biosynthesis
MGSRSHAYQSADPAVRQHLAPPADELSLRDLIAPLWAGRWIVVLVGGICAAVAGGLAIASVPAYEAVTVLRVIESKSADQAEPARPDNFRPLLQNKTIAESLVRDFGLVREPRYLWQAAGGPVAADQFGEVAQVEQVAATNLMQVRVKRADPEMAVKVANALADRAIALNRRINQQEVVEARDYIKSQLDEASKRVADVQARFVDIQQRSQVDALKRDAEVAIDLRSKLLELQADIEKERAFLARSEMDLAASQRLVTTRRSIDRDPLLAEAARERAPGTSLLGLGLSEEQVNEAYSALEKQAAESRAMLAGLEGQRKLLVDDKRLDRALLPILDKLYAGDVAVERLKAEYEMVLKVYTDLAVQYEDARIKVGGRGAQLQVVDAAVRPSAALPRRTVTSAALAGLGGTLAACAVLLARYVLNRWPRTPAAA